MKFCAVILAAGDGSRLKVTTPKPLVKINNKSIIEYIVDTFLKFQNIQIIVVVKKNSPIINLLGGKCKFVFQDKPKGTGHAVKCALDYIKQYDHTFISVSDSPLISYQTLKNMTNNHLLNNIDCSFLTSKFPQSYPYASIIRDKNMKITKCVEQQDANDKEKEVLERLSSHYLIKSKAIIDHIHSIKSNINTNEEYFTDIINILIRENRKIEGYKISNYKELIGINTPLDLKEIKNIING